MACVMPGADDLDEFWRNVVEGVNSITEVPPERWDGATYFDPDWDHATACERSGSASKRVGFLGDIAFDALAYGIPPASLAAIEPTQLLSLTVAADALADAGYGERDFDRDRTAVIFGAEGGTDQSAAHGFRALYPSYAGQLPPELDEWLPRISEDSFPGLLTNVNDVVVDGWRVPGHMGDERWGVTTTRCPALRVPGSRRSPTCGPATASCGPRGR